MGGWRVMRYLRIIMVIAFFITLSSFLARAGDIYMWTDKEGVVHITDDPHGLPPGDGVERIRYRNREDPEKQSLSDKGQDIEPLTEKAEKKEAVDDRVTKPPEEEPRPENLRRELEQAREEYGHAQKLVERLRRDYSRKSTRHNRDQYRHALKKLAEKRDRLRELERQK
jgi:vacuolar-type H+-ATPase subunit I/STV1